MLNKGLCISPSRFITAAANDTSGKIVMEKGLSANPKLKHLYVTINVEVDYTS